jgi:acetaldehyde dehydrogenase (acetylating)
MLLQLELDKDLESMQEMRNAVARAKEAQRRYEEFSQEEVDRIVLAAAKAAFAKKDELAKMAVEESGMGVAEHKAVKNEVASMGVYESIRETKTVGVIRENKKDKVVEIASPFGVIAGIVPTTNPTSSAIFKSLIALKTRNAIVFSPHPSAKGCTVEAARICLEAAIKAGAPEGIIGWISNPTMDATQALMRHRDVNLILATGGGALVRAAYSSGKPAYGVGPGNVPCYIEKTADIQKAVKRIVDSKVFDNGTICATEQALVVDRNIRDQVIREFKKHGAYFLNNEEKQKLEKVISTAPGNLNPKIVGRYASVIAKMAGIDVPAETTILIADESEVGKDFPFSIEKLAPIFPFYTVEGEKQAIDICGKLLALGGRGHSLALHSTDEQVIRRFSLHMPVSRLLVNSPSSIGAVGGTTGLKPSFTLGCGSFGGNITGDNISAEHLINIKRVAYGTKDIDIPKPQMTGESDHSSISEDKIQAMVEKVIADVGTGVTLDQQAITQMVSKVLAQI